MRNEKMNDNTEENFKNLSNKQVLYKDAIIEQDWIQLIDKHKLRYEIWTILKIQKELNVTEISHLVKQSKSTVSRVLIQMEKDSLIKSRRGEKKKDEGEKIPPKFYRVNEEYREKSSPKLYELEQPTDPIELRKFYLSQIKNFRNAIYNCHKLLDLLTPLLTVFEDQWEDIDRANQLYKMFLSDKNEPWFNIFYFDHEHFKEFFNIRLEYLLKLEKLAREQELNTKNTFVYFDASIPLKAIFELKKEKFSKRK